MKTEKQIKEYVADLRSKLDDALEHPDTSDYDAEELQIAIQELQWVLD